MPLEYCLGYSGNFMLEGNPLQAGCNLTIIRGGFYVITCLLVLQEISILSAFVTYSPVALIQIHGLRFDYRRQR